MRRNGTNSKVVFHERLVLPRLRDVVQGVMVLLESKANPRGHRVSHTRLQTRSSSCMWLRLKGLIWLVPRWVDSSLTGLFYSVSVQVFWSGVESQLGLCASTQAWLTSEHAQTNCFVDGPIIALKGTPEQRRMLAMGVLLWWSSLGLKLACEKGSFRSEVVWIGTHLMVNSRDNKVEVRLLAKKNVEIFTALSDLMDGSGVIIKHDEVRKVAGKESWVASVEAFYEAIVGQFVQTFDWRQSQCFVQATSMARTVVVAEVPWTSTWRVSETFVFGRSTSRWSGVGGGRQQRQVVGRPVGMVIAGGHNENHQMHLSALSGLQIVACGAG